MATVEEEHRETPPEGKPAQKERLPDGGPVYTETPPDPYAPNAPTIAEPWNTVTASFFIFIVFAWVWRLRGRYKYYPFLCCCMPILLAGGIGGTLYHATRLSRALFLLDLVPIIVLGVAGAVFMVIRYWGRYGLWFIPAIAAFYYGVNRLIFGVIRPTNDTWAVNLSYASLAVVVLIPIGLVLIRTRFRHGGWVVAGVISFAIAWFFRLVDRKVAPEMPMGSHWLWHTFGAITTTLIIEYFYLVESEKNPLEAPSRPSSR
jgi:hypothetical protein